MDAVSVGSFRRQNRAHEAAENGGQILCRCSGRGLWLSVNGGVGKGGSCCAWERRGGAGDGHGGDSAGAGALAHCLGFDAVARTVRLALTLAAQSTEPGIMMGIPPRPGPAGLAQEGGFPPEP